MKRWKLIVEAVVCGHRTRYEGTVEAETLPDVMDQDDALERVVPQDALSRYDKADVTALKIIVREDRS